jgi:hypothetical protein
MTFSWTAYNPSPVSFLDLTPNGFLVTATYSGSPPTISVWNISTSSVLPVVSSLTFGVTLNCIKIISSSLIALAVNQNYIQFVNVSQSGGLSLANKVNLPYSSRGMDMSLTAENYLVICQSDGPVTFLNVNTSTLVFGLTPFDDNSVNPVYIDLIVSVSNSDTTAGPSASPCNIKI